MDKRSKHRTASNPIGHFTRRSLLAGAGMVVASPAWAQNGDKHPVVLGQVYLSFYAVTGGVVHEILERLGHTVEVREGPHEKMFPLLGYEASQIIFFSPTAVSLFSI